jgi:hypothetical protein
MTISNGFLGGMWWSPSGQGSNACTAAQGWKKGLLPAVGAFGRGMP